MDRVEVGVSRSKLAIASRSARAPGRRRRARRTRRARRAAPRARPRRSRSRPASSIQGTSATCGSLQRVGGPAKAQQRLVGLHALQPHALQVRARVLRLARPSARRSRARRWPCRAARGIPRRARHAADVVEDGDAACARVAAADQRDAEVVARVQRAAALGAGDRRAAPRRRRRSRRAPSAGWPAAGRGPLPARPAAGARCARAPSAASGISRAGSGSWPGKYQARSRTDGGAPRCDQRREDLAGLACAGRTTAAGRRAGSRPRRRGARSRSKCCDTISVGHRREVAVLEEMEQRVAVVRILDHG